MATMIRSPYTGHTREQVRDLTDGYPVNQFCYHTDRHLIFKVNTKGYLHIYKPTKMGIGDIVRFYLTDYLIQDKGQATMIGPATRYFSTKQELLDCIRAMTGKEITT